MKSDTSHLLLCFVCFSLCAKGFISQMSHNHNKPDRASFITILKREFNDLTKDCQWRVNKGIKPEIYDSGVQVVFLSC